MHIARQTSQELVIVAGTRWVSGICAAAAGLILYIGIKRQQKEDFFLAAFFLLFAFIMDLRKTFKFDAMERTVRWNGQKILKAEAGEIPFDDITDIGTETKRAGNRNRPLYRLTIITPHDTIPMAYVYSGHSDGYSALRGQILKFVKPESAR